MKVSYRKASVTPKQMSQDEFLEKSSLDAIAACIQEIIDIEAPIKKDVLFKQIISSFGIPRSNATLEKQCEKALKNVSCKKSKEASKAVIWRIDQNPDTYSDFRVSAETEPRPIEDIPKVELNAAILDVLSEFPSLNRDDFVRQVSSELGFKHTGSKIKATLKQSISSCLKSGHISKDENGLFCVLLSSEKEESLAPPAGEPIQIETVQEDAPNETTCDSDESDEPSSDSTEASNSSLEEIAENKTAKVAENVGVAAIDITNSLREKAGKAVPVIAEQVSNVTENVQAIKNDVTEKAEKLAEEREQKSKSSEYIPIPIISSHLNDEKEDAAKSQKDGLLEKIKAKPKIVVACLAVLIVLLGGGALSSQAKPAETEQVVEQAAQPATIEAKVAISNWSTDSSPIGVAFNEPGRGTVLELGSDGKVSKECEPGTYTVTLDNDFYIMADGTLMQSGPSRQVDATEGQISATSLSLSKVDYTKTDTTAAEIYIDNAARYVEGKGQKDKAEKLKAAALALMQKSQTPATISDDGNLKIHYINVGQGDSEFIELPNGKTMLIDAGPSSAGGTVANYIKQLGYSKIDYLVASHPHEDHIGGMIAVMNAFEIGEIWAPKASNNTSTFEAFLDKAGSKGITTASAGKSIYKSDNLNIEVLSPRENATFSDLNDASVIIKITYKEKVFAFVGDASISIEKAALDEHVDILKVGHHGSEDATSADLVSKLSPSFAVISVGKNNYGLPDPEVIDLLATVSVFRTDVQGTVVATSDGSTISFNVPTPQTAAATAAEAAAAKQAQDEADAAAAAAAAEAAAPEVEESNSGVITVYITNTGKKYHNDGCSSLSKSKIPTTLEEAKAAGYTPCGRCNPPS